MVIVVILQWCPLRQLNAETIFQGQSTGKTEKKCVNMNYVLYSWEKPERCLSPAHSSCDLDVGGARITPAPTFVVSIFRQRYPEGPESECQHAEIQSKGTYSKNVAGTLDEGLSGHTCPFRPAVNDKVDTEWQISWFHSPVMSPCLSICAILTCACPLHLKIKRQYIVLNTSLPVCRHAPISTQVPRGWN